jgi:hypothetical protein
MAFIAQQTVTRHKEGYVYCNGFSAQASNCSGGWLYQLLDWPPMMQQATLHSPKEK